MWSSPADAVHCATPHRSSRSHQFSPSSPTPLLSHCSSTVMSRTLPLKLKLSYRSTLHSFSCLSPTHHQVVTSHSLNTNFSFFDNNLSYPYNSFTVFLLLYSSCCLTETFNPWFFSLISLPIHQSVSVVAFFCIQQ